MSHTRSDSTRLTEPEQLIGRRGWRGSVRALIASAAVFGLAATGGTGFLAHASFTEKQQRIAETAALTAAADLEHDQLSVGPDILRSRAESAAQDALDAARAAVEAAKGKTDASSLAATVAQLDSRGLVAPEGLYSLARLAARQVADVTAAVAEFDRLEAERKAAEEAARVAAEQRAAAERAAAEQAARANGGGGGGGGGPAAPANPSESQAIARDMIASRYGWGEDQFGCLVAVWNYESHWNPLAGNPSTGAYGIPQALPGSKMASHGADWQTNPATQISWGIDYIAGRYGNPCGAWAQIQSAGWY